MQNRGGGEYDPAEDQDGNALKVRANGIKEIVISSAICESRKLGRRAKRHRRPAGKIGRQGERSTLSLDKNTKPVLIGGRGTNCEKGGSGGHSWRTSGGSHDVAQKNTRGIPVPTGMRKKE